MPCALTSPPGLAPGPVRGVVARAGSTLDDVQDRLHLFPDDAAELVPGLLNLRAELLPDLPDLGLLLLGQGQLPHVRDAVSPPVTDAVPGLVLELRELLPLRLGQHLPHLLQLFPDEGGDLLADGLDLLLLVVSEFEGCD